ncbi:alkaline phosphatase [Desulfobacter curvatus]|uniref:alkaline phosphatase n=1 Tax=Desulfobacter curvatus TaxID=2290 RepID=UPI0003AA8EE1|nr:alkaline phosphatase [Desulfobacter curvatus]
MLTLKNLKKSGLITAIAVISLSLCIGTAFAGKRVKRSRTTDPKYIFYFIGDGMANVQIHAAEAYLAALVEDDAVPGSNKAELLAMSTEFPVQGMSTTFADNRLITDSAAAGTALACGKKTTVGVISQTPDGTSIATLAEKKPKKKV